MKSLPKKKEKRVSNISKSAARAKFNKLVDVYFEVALWLYENRNSLKEKFEADDYWIFDYPDYGGMPKKLSNQLNSALVDRIQDKFDEIYEARSFKQIVECLVYL